MTWLLGLPLEAALEALRAEGTEPKVTRALPHRPAQDDTGIWRVVRVKAQGAELTVSRFALSKVESD